MRGESYRATLGVFDSAFNSRPIIIYNILEFGL